MATIVKSLSTKGVEGYVVDVETKTISGQPMISIVVLVIRQSRRQGKGLRLQFLTAGLYSPR
jgi:hypothetical protein